MQIQRNQKVLVISERGPVVGRVTEPRNYGHLSGLGPTKHHGPGSDWKCGWRICVEYRPYPAEQVIAI